VYNEYIKAKTTILGIVKVPYIKIGCRSQISTQLMHWFSNKKRNSHPKHHSRKKFAPVRGRRWKERNRVRSPSGGNDQFSDYFAVTTTV